jgi:hypothetical protein
MTDTKTFNVRLRELRALRLFASEDESRYALNGVRIEVSAGQRQVMVATDGRRILCLRSECLGQSTFSITLHRSFIDRIERTVSDNRLLLGDELEITIHGIVATAKLVSYKIAVEDEAVIDENYPNWRQVIPKSPETPFALEWLALNANYVASYSKAASILGANDAVLKWRLHGKEAPVEIVCDRLKDFYDPLMAVQVDSQAFNKPEWI